MKSLAIGLVAVTLAAPAAATSLRITITNDAAPNGFALTPVYGALHNENFDAFDAGSTASDGVRALAELGDFGPVRGEREAATTENGVVTSQGVAFPVITPGGPRPIFGGETVVREVELTDVANQRFFTFLSMIVPSNDLFIGSDDPIELFDAAGTFLGTKVLNLTGTDVYDAGTEINDPAANPAFVAGVPGVNPLIDPNDPSLGSLADENGVVRGGQFAQLRLYAGLDTVPGFTTAPEQNLFGAASAFNIATITIEQVTAPVPLPAGGVLLVSGLVGAGVMVRRKAKRRAT